MTRKLATIFCLVFALSLTALAQAPAAPTKIGIIDIQGAIIATNEGQRDLNALSTKFEPKKNELQAAGAEIEKLKNQLNTQERMMNDDARSKLMRDIDTKSKTFQRNMEDAQNEFGTQQNEIANRIGAKLLQLLQKYATDNGYSVILNVSGNPDQPNPVLWAAQSANITKAIVDLYNTQSGVPAQPAAGAAKPAAPAAKPAAPATKKP